jgi:Icc-related predicted phosphoesterase
MGQFSMEISRPKGSVLGGNQHPFARFTPSRSARMHVDSRAFLRSALSKTEKPTVVVTHHAPSRQSLPEHLRDDMHSPAYASDLEHVMLDFKPAAWVHGHVHEKVDYAVGQTWVFSDPRGYPGERDDFCDYHGTVFEI